MTAQREWSAPAVPDSVARLRQAVARFGESVGVRERALDDLCLAVSEALTNAVVHAYRGGDPGPVLVRAAADDDHVAIEVEDHGMGVVPRADSPGLGLGLPLIVSVCQESSVAARAGGGTVVRMTFARSG